MMEGRGEILNRIETHLKDSYLVLLFPGIHVSTAEAYGGVVPKVPDTPLQQLISKAPDLWKDLIINRFEDHVCAKYPLINELKIALYHAGAQYASMSGSGSSIYGVFRKQTRLPGEIRKYVIWEGPA